MKNQTRGKDMDNYQELKIRCDSGFEQISSSAFRIINDLITVKSNGIHLLSVRQFHDSFTVNSTLY